MQTACIDILINYLLSKKGFSKQLLLFIDFLKCDGPYQAKFNQDIDRPWLSILTPDMPLDSFIPFMTCYQRVNAEAMNEYNAGPLTWFL